MLLLAAQLAEEEGAVTPGAQLAGYRGVTTTDGKPGKQRHHWNNNNTPRGKEYGDTPGSI